MNATVGRRAPLVLGLRGDASRLGWALTWGTSLLQLALGMAIENLRAVRRAVRAAITE